MDASHLPTTNLLLLGKFFDRNLKQTLSTYTTHKSPHVTHVPTLTGGIGAAELEKFYSQYFCNPSSLDLTLLSRTSGADRVIDEMHVKFKHTEEMPWILPGVSPTNKRVEIAVVSIVTLRGGKLYHEHVYWDQASVLFQIGLLDPTSVPKDALKPGAEKLPIVGKEAARRLLRGWDAEEEGEADNELITGWTEDAAKGTKSETVGKSDENEVGKNEVPSTGKEKQVEQTKQPSGDAKKEKETP